MGTNDLGQNASLLDYRDLPIKLPTSTPFDVRQAMFGNTIRKLGQYATKGETIVWRFLSKDVEIPLLQHNELRNRLRHGHTREQKKEETKEKLLSLGDKAKRTGEVLVTARTVFPLTLFHDDICVDRSKVTITRRHFFFMSEVMSISKEDILNVKVALGPFFGSITIAVRILNSEDHHTINNLWRKDAVHLKHLIQGYIVAKHSDIDCSGLDKDELVDTLCQLGHDAN